MVKFCVEMVELRCQLAPAASKVTRLKASNLSLRQTYLQTDRLTEWFIVLHFVAKNGSITKTGFFKYFFLVSPCLIWFAITYEILGREEN